MDPTDLINLLPSGPTRDKLLTAVVILGIAGRIYQAVRNGGGIKACLAALIFGTNTPKTPNDK